MNKPKKGFERKQQSIPKVKSEDAEKESASDPKRLNKYIANSGICSRREADKLIEAGDVKVNGKVVTQMGYQVQPKDKVQYKGKFIKPEKNIYVLLNKPKGFITTTKDPEGRKTVMDLVKKACEERIYPVGRLDRHTTGLLLFTNDGDFAQKLAHPSQSIPKLYEVLLDKAMSDSDFEKIQKGTILEDGELKVDDIAIVSPDSRSIGVKIHSGKNRIIRRLFEHYSYTVVKLDRVMYAGLDKKGLTRGHWRMLNEKEIIRLKYFQ
jgi:23S rRNA pseudouridine2605 synthase